jgi:acyl-CoA synthetase (AMP-forming)/AMP-acid ligase II/alkylation response protein AidB-like acyl-CoA dehydrogenase/acyl carrier protein
VAETGEPHPQVGLVTDRVRAAARRSPERIAYTFLHEDGRAEDIRYGELEQRVLALAGALAARLTPGERALLLYPAGLDFIVAWFACLFAGVVAVPAAMSHRRRGSRRLQALLADADPALVLTTRACAATVAASLVNDKLAAPECLCTDTAPVVHASAFVPPLHGAMTAVLQYTSGATAQPRGVELTHANITANVEAIRLAFGFNERSVMASWLPLFHDMGLIGSVAAPMAIGFRSVLMAPSTFLKHPARWLEAITRYRASCAGAPDFGWDYCARRIGEAQKAGLDLSCLELAYNGAEPVRAATLRAFEGAFAAYGFRSAAPFPCYGMAEATLLVTGGPRGRVPKVWAVSKLALEANQVRAAAPGDPDAREVVSCGPPASGVRLMLVDPETSLPVARHRIGEVWVAGPGVARGYFRRPAESAATFGARLDTGDGAGAYLRSGDLGFLRDGELYITGRLKDLLIVNGRNIYPQDIEELVERCIDFVEPNGCAAFALEEGGRERMAVVVEADRALVRAVRGGGRLAQVDAQVQELRREVGRQFDLALGPVLFVRPGSFPRTTSGKVQRARCKALAQAGELQLVHVNGGALAHRAPPPAQAAESRASADAMIAWFRHYAARRLNSRLIDERRTIPPYVVLDLGSQGFFGLQAPLEFGGRALRAADLMRVLEQLAAVDLTVATVIGVHNGLGLRPLLRFGLPELQRRLLPRLASGRQLAAYAQTEPQAGSNPLAMQARAERVPGGWRVSAQKHLIGLASWAGMMTVLAKAFDPAGVSLGMIALLVPEHAAGLSHGPEALTMGMRGMVQNTVLFDEVLVPDEDVLLAPGEGMEVARDAMGFARLGIGALCVGAMKRCAQLMARYGERREIATGRLADNPVTVVRLHDLTCAIGAAEALVGAIAAALDAGEPLSQEACLACKYLSSELLWEAADRLVQLLGGRGYLETNIAPQMLRDARVLRILEGPSETLCMHLGASAASPGGGAFEFVAGALGRPRLAAELAAVLAGARDRTAAAPPFASEAVAGQWLDYRAGQLWAWAMLQAAAEQRAQQAGLADGGASADAAAWAGRRLARLRHAIMAGEEGAAAYPPAPQLIARIDAYAASIGQVEQGLAGEAQQLDPLLRRQSAPLQPHRERAAAVPPTSTQQMVHDVVLKWLRSDGTACAGIGYDTPFSELGVDSLGTVPIALDLEQLSGLPILPELLYDHQSVNALAAYIDERRAQAQGGA